MENNILVKIEDCSGKIYEPHGQGVFCPFLWWSLAYTRAWSPIHLYVHLVTHRKWTFKLVRIRHWQKNADLVVVLHIFDRCSDLVFRAYSIFIISKYIWLHWSFPSISLVVPGLYRSIVPNTFVCTFGDTPKVDL